jgi:hypothetical protein
MFHIRTFLFSLPIATACVLGIPPDGQAQDAPPSPTSEQGKETGNWGLAPFIPIPTLALSAEAKQSVRDLEDRQLSERRALEDKFNEELLALLKKQAGEREALILSLTTP